MSPKKPCRLRDSKVSSLLAFPGLGAYGITGDHLISGSGVGMSKTTVVIECIPSDEAGIFRVSIHDESGDGGIFSQSAAKPNCAPVFSVFGVRQSLPTTTATRLITRRIVDSMSE